MERRVQILIEPFLSKTGASVLERLRNEGVVPGGR